MFAWYAWHSAAIHLRPAHVGGGPMADWNVCVEHLNICKFSGNLSLFEFSPLTFTFDKTPLKLESILAGRWGVSQKAPSNTGLFDFTVL